MNDLIWSFVEGLETGAEGRVFRLLYKQETLHRIGYPKDIDLVPPGLLIEGCAQSGGLTLFLEDPHFQSLPVLAKVNRARFFSDPPVNQILCAQPILTHLSESGAQFECRCFDTSTGLDLAECEFLLGFLPFDQVPDGGKEARKGLEKFIAKLKK